MNFKKQIDRFTTSSLLTATTAYATDAFPCGDFNLIGISILTNHDVSAILLWGRDTDAADALPHSYTQVYTTGSGEGGGQGYSFPLPPNATKARVKISNASGSTATLTCDVGLTTI